MRQNRLLILGASVRWLMQSARRAGLEVTGIDFFADVDASAAGQVVPARNWLEMVALAEEISPSAILMGGGFETQEGLRQQLRNLAPLWNCAEAGIAASRTPDVWGPAILAAGLKCPQWGDPKGEESLGIPVAGRWVVKQRYSAGGNGVRELGSSGLAENLSLAPGEFCQQWIEGEAMSAQFFIAAGGGVDVELFRQLCGDHRFGAKPFQYCGAIGPVELTVSLRHQLLTLGRVLHSELGLVGLVGVDLVRQGESLFPVEINPRPTATMELLERAGRCNSLVAWQAEQFGGQGVTKASAGEFPRQAGEANRPQEGKAILFWPGESQLEIEARQACLLKGYGDEGWLADIPRYGSRIGAGEPVATIFASGASTHEVYSELDLRAQQVRFGLTGKYFSGTALLPRETT